MATATFVMPSALSGSADGVANNTSQIIAYAQSSGTPRILRVGQYSGLSFDSVWTFGSVNISSGSTITLAKLIFHTPIGSSGDTVDAILCCYDADDGAQFADYAAYAAAAKTTGVNWDNIAEWTGVDPPEGIESVDFSSSLQEVIDRVGWVPGNDVTVFMQDNSNPNGSYRNPLAREEDPSGWGPYQVMLYVEWTEPGTELNNINTIHSTIVSYGPTLFILSYAGEGWCEVTEPADSVSMTGNLGISIIEAPDTLEASGFMTRTGTVSVIEANDSVSVSGFFNIAATEPADSVIIEAAFAQYGTVAVTEPADTIIASAFLDLYGSIIVTENDDSISVQDFRQLFGTASVIEPLDSAVLQGTVGIAGSLSVTEPVDTLSAIAFMDMIATLTVTEVEDEVEIYAFSPNRYTDLILQYIR